MLSKTFLDSLEIDPDLRDGIVERGEEIAKHYGLTLSDIPESLLAITLPCQTFDALDKYCAGFPVSEAEAYGDDSRNWGVGWYLLYDCG